MTKIAPILVLPLALLHVCTAAKDKVEAGAAEVIDLTRQTSATYSVYTWNTIPRFGDDPIEEWAAEFHDGRYHRVETPRDRVVADCAAMTGTHRNLATGEVMRSPEIAKSACGVAANATIVSAREEAAGTGRFGAVWRIVVRDPRNERTYEVAANGAIVAATIKLHDGTLLLESRAFALLGDVPPSIFSEASLRRSAVAAQYRRPPETGLTAATPHPKERAD